MKDPFKLFDKDVVFLDTETDGLPRDSQIWEIAIISRYGTYHRMIDIEQREGKEESLNVGGYHDRHPHGKNYTESQSAPVGLVSQKQAAKQIAELTNNCHIVCANTIFDIGVLTTMFDTVGVNISWNYHVLDIESAALAYLAREGKLKDASRWSSYDLSRLCGVEPPEVDEQHTAVGDTLWVQRWYAKLFDVSFDV